MSSQPLGEGAPKRCEAVLGRTWRPVAVVAA